MMKANMRFHYAGTDNMKFAGVLGSVGVTSVLSSFWSINGPKYKHTELPKLAAYLIRIKRAAGAKYLFLDCGAFSAWMQKSSIDLDLYMTFCYLLDRSGEPGIMYAALDDKNSEPKTMANLKKMEARGLHPLPVWHASSGNFDDLKELLDKYDYIAVGAIVGEGMYQNQEFIKKLEDMFKMAFSYGKNPDGSMKKKFHAFGVSNTRFLLMFPWYTSDSTTWLSGARFGNISIFDPQKGTVMNIAHKSERLMKKYYHLIPAAYRNMLNIVDDEQQNYVNRLKISITAFNLLEEYITKVWKGRGISYDD